MTMQHVVILVAALPLIGALVCRVNAMTDGPRRFFVHPVVAVVNAVLLIAAGWVFFACLQVPPEMRHWVALTCGWLWVLATLPSVRRSLIR